MCEVPDLQVFWKEPQYKALQCLVCKGSFIDDALIRTFRVSPSTPEHDWHRQCSRVVHSNLGVDILLFDRHLHCILDTGLPLLISHVWDPKISEIQQRTGLSPQPPEVRRLTFEKPVRIFRGIDEDEPSEDWECWHDYFSVPQWTDELKRPILLKIHEIFEKATSTVIHYDDLEQESVHKLYHGETSDERLQGMTDICNARWFTRMWTAMELIRSRRIKMMTSDFHLVKVAGADPAFLTKLHEVWKRELREDGGDVYRLERKVGMMTHGNFVPWNLGPLNEVRSLGVTNFAMAFALLSKRGCRDSYDFLHGLRGITSKSHTTPPKEGFREGYLHAARTCLQEGDLSPILMTPDFPMYDDRKDGNWWQCYYEINTWELGEETSPPDHTNISWEVRDSKTWMSLRLQPIGIVSALAEPDWTGALEHLASCVDITLAQTGPDLHDFVATLGTRLYGEQTSAIMQHLTNEGLVETLQEALRSQYIRREWRPTWRVERLGRHGDNALEWLADALLLREIVPEMSQTRLELILASFGTMHLRTYCRIASITCPRCLKTSLFRVGLFVPADEARLARAWRIPGLQYRMSHKGGMAILEANGRIVGRMMWATPACECTEMEIVALQMPDLPDPQPYNFKGWPSSQ